MTAEQRSTALERANEVRLGRAVLKEQIRCGEVSVGDVLRSVPEAAMSWPVAGLLACQPRWGDARIRRFLAGVRVGEMRPVGLLTERQRGELAGLLRRGGTR